MLQLWKTWPQNSEWNICRRFRMPTASVKSSAMTKCNLRCRPMRWSVQNTLVFASVLIHKCLFYIVKIVYNTCLIFKLNMIVMSFFDLQVDKHIRRLDADLARFENELKEKLEVGGYESTDGRAVKSELRGAKLPRVLVGQTCIQLHVFLTEGESRGLREKRGSRGRGRKGSDDDSPKKKKMKTRYLQAEIPHHPSHVLLVLIRLCLPLSPDLSDALLPMQPSDVLDMPVDPNEPTYCLCHQVSYGEMIGCDNPDVSVQLFSYF